MPWQQIWPHCISLVSSGSTNNSHQKNFEKAASLLKELSIASTEHSWSVIECALMKLYAKCLREIGDVDGQINVLLKLILHRSKITHKEGIQYVDDLEQGLSQISTRMSSPDFVDESNWTSFEKLLFSSSQCKSFPARSQRRLPSFPSLKLASPPSNHAIWNFSQSNIDIWPRNLLYEFDPGNIAPYQWHMDSLQYNCARTIYLWEYYFKLG